LARAKLLKTNMTPGSIQRYTAGTPPSVPRREAVSI
jgi:hypothetical protein